MVASLSRCKAEAHRWRSRGASRCLSTSWTNGADIGGHARNIRAYRERGLLDRPRRVRSFGVLDDYHLSQLKPINQLLRRGFNSAHIAEFFASMRQGADLADILGIQRAILGPRSDEDRAIPVRPSGTATVGINPGRDEARKLIDYGIAELVDGEVVFEGRHDGCIVARTPDPMLYVRAMLRVFESTRKSIDNLAADFVRASMSCTRRGSERRKCPSPRRWPS